MKKLIFLSVLLNALYSYSAPNPAYIYCVKNGGYIETRRDEVGNEYGICNFEINNRHSECGQWAFIRQQCQPDTCAYWSIYKNACQEPL